MSVRYYVDADTLGLAHAMASLRSDVTYPGDPGGMIHRKPRPPCVVTETRTPDEVWIPVVGREGWSVITRDARILRRPHELGLVRDHAVRMFTITSREKMHNWDLLEVVMCNWRRIEELSLVPGPFVYTMTRTALAKFDLD